MEYLHFFFVLCVILPAADLKDKGRGEVHVLIKNSSHITAVMKLRTRIRFGFFFEHLIAKSCKMRIVNWLCPAFVPMLVLSRWSDLDKIWRGDLLRYCRLSLSLSMVPWSASIPSVPTGFYAYLDLLTLELLLILHNVVSCCGI